MLIMRKPLKWREQAKGVEKALHEWLGLAEDTAVIYVNRAAAGIHMALGTFSVLPTVYAEWPNFHAVGNISERLGFECHACSREVILNRLTGSFSVVAPVALGGEAIHKEYWDIFSALMYDCAQTCYFNMFKGLTFKPTQYAVLSFEESKPMGSWCGGGALVCHKKRELKLREHFIPGRYYFNPRAYQCISTLDELNTIAAIEQSISQRKKHDTQSKKLKNVVNNHTVVGESNIFTHIYSTSSIPGGEPYASNHLWRMQL